MKSYNEFINESVDINSSEYFFNAIESNDLDNVKEFIKRNGGEISHYNMIKGIATATIEENINMVEFLLNSGEKLQKKDLWIFYYVLLCNTVDKNYDIFKLLIDNISTDDLKLIYAKVINKLIDYKNNYDVNYEEIFQILSTKIDIDYSLMYYYFIIGRNKIGINLMIKMGIPYPNEKLDSVLSITDLTDVYKIKNEVVPNELKYIISVINDDFIKPYLKSDDVDDKTIKKEFDFTNYKYLPVNVDVTIFGINVEQPKNAVGLCKFIENDKYTIELYVKKKDILLSVLSHELNHMYDTEKSTNVDSDDKNLHYIDFENYNINRKDSEIKNMESLTYRLSEAEISSYITQIYYLLKDNVDKLNYDKDSLWNYYKKSHYYKILDVFLNFKFPKEIYKLDDDKLIIFTQDYYKSITNKPVYIRTIDSAKKTLNIIEEYIHKQGKEILSKVKKTIDDYIKDHKPYMESKKS